MSTDQRVSPQPLTVDQIDSECDQLFYGVKVCQVNEGESLFCFTDDRRRAIAAARRYCRDFCGERMWKAVVSEPRWIQVFDHCGCPPEHICKELVYDGKEVGYDCECDHGGLPPCSDVFGWKSSPCKPDALNALQVIEIEHAI